MSTIRSNRGRRAAQVSRPWIAVTTLALGITVLNGCGSGDSGTVNEVVAAAPGDSASQIAACATTNEAAGSWQGLLSVSENGAETFTGSFVLLEDGSHRFDVTYPSGERAVTMFDAATRRSEGSIAEPGRESAGPLLLEMTDQAPTGPFAQDPLIERYLHRSLARAASASSDADSPYLLVSFDVPARDQIASGYADEESKPEDAHVEATVHVPSGLACEVRISTGSSEIVHRLTGVEPFTGTRDDLRVPQGEGRKLEARSGGFRTIDRASAGGLVPYDIVVPDSPLAGFTLEWVGHAGAAAGGGGEVRDVLVAVYRNGDQEIVITQSSASDIDPYRLHDVTSATAVAGRRIETSVKGLVLVDASGPGRLPHAWGTNGEITVSVGGDLTADELAAVAATLRSE